MSLNLTLSHAFCKKHINGIFAFCIKQIEIVNRKKNGMQPTWITSRLLCYFVTLSLLHFLEVSILNVVIGATVRG